MLGIGLCWQWQLRGLITSLVLLAGSISYEFLSMTPTEIIWNTGAALSFALSLIIITLSRFKESPQNHQNIDALPPHEKQSDFVNMIESDMDSESDRDDMHATRHEELKMHFAALQSELKALFNHKTTDQSLIDSLQTALQTAQKQQQEIFEEHVTVSKLHLDAAQKNADLKTEFAELRDKFNSTKQAEQKLADQQFTFTDQLSKENKLREAAEQKYADLLNNQKRSQEILQKEKEFYQSENSQLVSQHQKEITAIELKWQSSQNENQQLQSSHQKWEQQLNALHKQIEELTFTNNHAQQTIQSITNENEEYLHKIDELNQQLELKKTELQQAELKSCQAFSESKAPSTHLEEEQPDESKKSDRALRIAKGQIKELRSQFTDKSNQLDETRRLLFHAEEKLLAQQQKQDELDINLHPEYVSISQQLKLLEIEFSETESTYKKEIDDLNDLISTLLSESLTTGVNK